MKAKPTYVTITKVNYPDGFLRHINCVITGGGSGLGFSMAKKMVSYGANVILTGRRENTLKEACRELGAQAKYIVYDSMDFNGMSDFWGNIVSLMPNVNSLVLNAGVSLHEGSIENVENGGFDIQFNTNFKSAYFMAKEFIRRIGNGNILFISSETGAMKCQLPYGLTKTLIDSLVPALSGHYYTKGIRVNGIAPGSTITNMVKNGNKDSNDIYYPNAANRYFLPDEVAEVAAFLLSDCSKCISGEIIHTNAGNHMRIQ